MKFLGNRGETSRWLVERFHLALSLGVLVAMLVGAVNNRQANGQGFNVEAKTAPSVTGAGPYVSLEGRFSIALPGENHGFSPIAVTTPVGNAVGDAFRWQMKEGSFTAIYVDAERSLEDAETSKRVFASIRSDMQKLALSNNGSLAAEKTLNLNSHPGAELRVDFFTGYMIQRLYVSSHRLYQLVFVAKNEQRGYEAVTNGVLDSFAILSDEQVLAEKKKEEEKAEPEPLPQHPELPRAGSDVADENLHGRVKSIVEESQDLSGTWSIQTRKPDSASYYNDHGNLTRKVLYDYRGNLSEITVYGYIDGARVSNWKTVKREYNPPPMVVSLPKSETKINYDSRYQTKFVYQYDKEKRLVEESIYGNEGKLRVKYVYKYSGQQRDTYSFDVAGKVNRHSVSIFDDKGQIKESSTLDVKDGSVESKNVYEYVDTKGNWTKRTTSRITFKDGKSINEPRYVTYRTIVYYP